MSISSLQRQLRHFAAERDWEQFHSPKNLVMALTGEVGELTEIFQWLRSPERKSHASGLNLTVREWEVRPCASQSTCLC